ncbi:cytochrome P450 2H1-like [Haemaphysalis longicornis]
MVLDLLQSSLMHVVDWAHSCSTATSLLVFVVTVLLTLNALTSRHRKYERKRLPPGPTGVPILGYIPFIRKPFHLVFKELSEKYGPIIRLRLGCKDVVVLNDLDSIREGLANPDVLFRTDDFVFRYLGIKGIVSMNGEPWQHNRRYCFHVLRNLGFGKKTMDKHIQEEVQCFLDILRSGDGKPAQIAQPLASSVVNNISALVFGRRYDADHPKGRTLEALLSKFLRNGNFFSLLDFLPVLRVLSLYTPNTRLHIMNNVFIQMRQLVRNEVKEREGKMEQYLDRDFIDGYLRKINENQGTNHHYTLQGLEGNSINFYGAATNTVRTVILWNLYIAAADPGHQTRVQREIDTVIGKQRAPGWEDRHRMPFTMASILEALRWKTTAPIGIHRAAGRDTVIGGYDVPAGTFVVPNFWALHNDPVHWPNPSQYDPTRFLNADGTELGKRPEAFVSFSLGRRACPGESLALMEIFLYVSTVLQNFRVLPEEGKTLSLDAENALISVVDDTQRLRFLPR